MTEPMGNLAPNDSFIVNTDRQMTDYESRALTALYRPLLSSDAYSLAMTLWELNEEATVLNEQFTHTILLNWLGIDLPAIMEARGRLEALGLLKTFRKQVDNRALFLYVLQAPADPITFFKDDTLSALLLGAVGENEFERLSRRLIKRQVEHADFYDVSKNLGDYFQIGSSVVDKPRPISAVQKQIQPDEPQTDSETLNNSFDFNLLTQMLSTSFVDRQSLEENRHLIMVEQTIYGITESEMAELIKSATNFQDNRIDSRTLKTRIAQKYANANQQGAKKTASSAAMPTSLTKLNLEGLTAEEQTVIKSTYALAPVDFIDQIKQETGGFTTTAEKRVITGIVETGQLPVSVVNFLIFYVLVDQGRATLNKNLVEAIANEWIKNGVKTPQKALEFVRERQAKKQKQATKSYGRRKPVVQRETLPDWAKKDTKTATNNANDSQAVPTTAEINAKLKKLRERRKEE
ncbi:replication initiation and membrane attachment family protein [Pediococcus acidilactici]|uniref:replication initiation and membrane attachment family protein n=1 Tax=Pediococcus acidilactici TaxID=1254 RepID=UPI001869BA1D|nr:DnaD domain protein [Pediococcus acidilactici]QOP74296.1 DnaD domain protein [Pediococcus acidilactici]